MLVLYDAAPATRVGIASWVWPSSTVRVPVGTPDPVFGATEMFSVNIWPVVSCVADGETEVVVAVFAGAETVMEREPEVDAAKFASPEYWTVRECVPFVRVEVVSVAEPELRFAVPIWVVPSKKAAVPVGVPEPDLGATVAVNVTLWPVVICVLEAASVVVVAARLADAGVKTKTVAEYEGKL